MKSMNCFSSWARKAIAICKTAFLRMCYLWVGPKLECVQIYIFVGIYIYVQIYESTYHVASVYTHVYIFDI